MSDAQQGQPAQRWARRGVRRLQVRRRRHSLDVVLALLAIASMSVIVWLAAAETDPADRGDEVTRTVIARAHATDATHKRVTPPGLAHGARAAYRYSVVPRGVQNAAEVAAAMRDPAVKLHYDGIDAARLRPTRLQRAREMYVSYRKDGVIAWTRRPVRIPPGDAVLTDGTHLVRARCANRLSDRPMSPTLDDEPERGALDEVAPDVGPAGLIGTAPFVTPRESAVLEAVVVPGGPVGETPGFGTAIPGRDPGRPETGNGTPEEPLTPDDLNPTDEEPTPRSVPEPRVAWLVATATAWWTVRAGRRSAVPRLRHLLNRRFERGGLVLEQRVGERAANLIER